MQIDYNLGKPKSIFRLTFHEPVDVSEFRTIYMWIYNLMVFRNYSAPRLGYINFWSKQRKYNFCFIIALLRKVDNFSM